MSQENLNEIYVTAGEICDRLLITRPSITFAMRKGRVPKPLKIGKMMVWIRKDIEPILEEWEKELESSSRSKYTKLKNEGI